MGVATRCSLPQLGDGVVVADFLTLLDNGSGGWKNGTYADAGHPNDLGHSLMFESLNETFYDAVDLVSFSGASHCG